MADWGLIIWIGVVIVGLLLIVLVVAPLTKYLKLASDTININPVNYSALNNKITEAFGQAESVLASFINTAVPVINTGIDAFTTGVTTIGQGVNSLITQTTPTIATVVTDILGDTSDLISTTGTVVDESLTVIGQVGTQSLQVLEGVIGDIAQNTQLTTINAGLGAINGVVPQLVSVIGTLSGTLNQLNGVGYTSVAKIIGAIGSAITTITSPIENILHLVGQLTSSLGNLTGGGGILGGLTGGGGGIFSGAENVATSIGHGIESAFGNIF